MGSETPEHLERLPSKSQRKREAKVLFDLARKLVSMSVRELDSLPVEESLRESIDHARSIRSNVARKRQLQFVAKLMRRQEVSGIRAALEDMELKARQATVRHHRVEAWRDRLLGHGDAALGELLAARNSADAQALRRLVRQALAEARLEKPPAAARKLFGMLRDMDSLQSLPPLNGGD